MHGLYVTLKQLTMSLDILRDLYIPGFLKTGLAKMSTNSASWQFQTRKLVQKPIKNVYRRRAGS